MPDQIASFDAVLKAELSELRERRRQVLGAGMAEPSIDDDGIRQAHQFRALGLTLSGGGIRSATFNLGILQGLASHKLLPYIDYLSTVSGGGYIGSWLHGVIRRKDGGDPRKTGERLDPVKNPRPGPAKEDPISFLRKYSSYLSPRSGLFTPDAWVIASIWVRNMVLNQLILVPFLAAVIVSAMLIGYGIRDAPPDRGNWIGFVSFAFLLIAMANAAWSLRVIAAREFGKPASTDPPRSLAWPTAAGILLFSLYFFWLHRPPDGEVDLGTYFGFSIHPPWWGIAMFILFFLFQTLGGFVSCFWQRHHHHKNWVWIHLLWMPAVAAAATTWILSGLMTLIAGFDGYSHAVIWGPPSLVAGLVCGVTLLIGLMGADFPDASREWLSRVGAVLAMNSFAWLVILGLSIFGPYTIAWLGATFGPKVMATPVLAWAGTTLAGVLAGKSTKTGGEAGAAKKNKVGEWLLNIAPTVFLIGLIILIAAGCQWGIATLSKANGDPEYKSALYILLMCAGLAILLPLRVNINEFSMHHFYKNRLVRCYLGAGNAKQRKPNPFTGFDPKDDLLLADLVPSERDKDGNPYLGPYPIVNTALNLNAGSELATQERKASSFIFTPKYCGYDPPHGNEKAPPDARLADDAYRETKGFGYPVGPRIGTAMAISGAAANPNWGYHTSAPVAFLLTVFNVRLGWWVGNPRVRCKWEALCPSKRPGPLNALKWLILELFGQTTGASAYVNLSDGGHFENLGLYELVRRRCRYIIVGDGEQDNNYTFESLGGAIRKCRADFGVEINIDIEQIRTAEASKRTHCVVGTILYSERRAEPTDSEPIAEGGEVPASNYIRGWILYFKSSLTGDEPEDVKQYHETHPDFPHETTMNQFFTESQFESYRRLGLHVVESAFENVGELPDEYSGATLTSLFQRMAALWYAPSSLAPGVATLHAEAYSALLKRLDDDPVLSFLDDKIIVTASPDQPPARDAKDRKAYFFMLDLIQLMENVWSDFSLDVAANRDNPKNQGWMRVFRHWAQQPIFKSVWNEVQQNYNPLFGDFVRLCSR